MPDAPRKQSKKVSRREFARGVAVAAAAAAILPANVLPSPAALPQAAAETKPLSTEAQAEVEAKYQAILRRYGRRLSEDQKKDIHRLLVEGQPPLEKLRAFPLENSNEPATDFIPHRAPSPARPTARKER